jgi:hypothetical protein
MSLIVKKREKKEKKDENDNYVKKENLILSYEKTRGREGESKILVVMYFIEYLEEERHPFFVDKAYSLLEKFDCAYVCLIDSLHSNKEIGNDGYRMPFNVIYYFIMLI